MKKILSMLFLVSSLSGCSESVLNSEMLNQTTIYTNNETANISSTKGKSSYSLFLSNYFFPKFDYDKNGILVKEEFQGNSSYLKKDIDINILFNNLDNDKDGRVTLNELKRNSQFFASVVGHEGMSLDSVNNKVNKEFDVLDLNKDKFISEKEYMKQSQTPEYVLSSGLFQLLDKNSDDKLNSKEFNNNYINRNLFNELDLNKDGYILRNEFKGIETTISDSLIFNIADKNQDKNLTISEYEDIVFAGIRGYAKYFEK